MQINQDWDIKPRGTMCAMCQGPFTDKQPYVSQLSFETEGYVRRDYCLACWAKGGIQPAASSAEPDEAAQPSAPSAAESMPDKAVDSPVDNPQAGNAPEAQKGASTVSVWKGVFHPPPPPPEEPLKKETAESLLRSLMEKNEPARKNVIFILAVMLERRRLLVERDLQTREDGATIRVYEHRGTGETFLITDPHLDLNQLGHVQEEVLAMLAGNPETDAAVQAAPAETPPVDESVNIP